jgi:hypothetical protein
MLRHCAANVRASRTVPQSLDLSGSFVHQILCRLRICGVAPRPKSFNDVSHQAAPAFL